MKRVSIVKTAFFAFFLVLLAGCTKNADIPKESAVSEISAETTEEKVISDDPFTRVPPDLGFENYLSILKEALGKDADYGFLYGTTAALCEKNGLCESEIVADNRAASELLNENNLYFLDFTLPLFEDKFVTAEESKLTKVLAKRFCRYVYDTYGFKKLKELCFTDATDNERVTLKNEWLNSEGVSLTYEPVGCYAFEYNDNLYSDNYPYVIFEPGFNMYFSTNDVLDEGYAEFMKGYALIHEYAPADFVDAQEKYWKNVDERTKVPVDIYTRYKREADDEYYDRFAGIYDPSRNMILLMGDWYNSNRALVHEYIHYLDRRHTSNTDSMIFEAYTEELAAYECQNNVRRKNGFLSDADEEFYTAIGAYDKETGYYDMAVTADVFALAEYLGVRKSWYSVTGGVAQSWSDGRDKILFSEMSYEAASSFYHYLVNKLGAKKVHLASGLLREFYELFEGDYMSYYTEWGEGLCEKYKDRMPAFEAYFYDNKKVN